LSRDGNPIASKQQQQQQQIQATPRKQQGQYILKDFIFLIKSKIINIE
jgi:hypothetical protein